MTLGNMRELGVRSLFVTCELCHHRAAVSADRWGDAVLVELKIAHRSARPSAIEGRPSVPGTPSARQPVTRSRLCGSGP